MAGLPFYAVLLVKLAAQITGQACEAAGVRCMPEVMLMQRTSKCLGLKGHALQGGATRKMPRTPDQAHKDVPAKVQVIMYNSMTSVNCLQARIRRGEGRRGLGAGPRRQRIRGDAQESAATSGACKQNELLEIAGWIQPYLPCLLCEDRQPALPAEETWDAGLSCHLC